MLVMMAPSAPTSELKGHVRLLIVLGFQVGVRVDVQEDVSTSFLMGGRWSGSGSRSIGCQGTAKSSISRLGDVGLFCDIISFRGVYRLQS